MVHGQCWETYQNWRKFTQQVGRCKPTDRDHAHIQVPLAALTGGTGIELILLYKRWDVANVP